MGKTLFLSVLVTAIGVAPAPGAPNRDPDAAELAFGRAMAFMGCQPMEAAMTTAPHVSESDRIAAARLMLLKLGLASDDPGWSSDVLDRLLRAVVETPDGAVSDLFRALFGVLRDYRPDLSKPIAAFIKDVVVRCFTRYRRSYDLIDWHGLIAGLGDQATPAQLYLTLHAVPPQFVGAQLAGAIVKGLESTAFRDEATGTLVV